MTSSRASLFGRLLIAVALLATLALGLFDALQPATAHDPNAKVVHLFASGSATGGKIITVRPKLDEPLTSNTTITFTSSHPDVIPGFKMRMYEGDQENVTRSVRTTPVYETTIVTLTASVNGSSASNEIIVREPYHSSLSTQTVCRAGGLCRVIPRFSGRAPDGGLEVAVWTDRPDVLDLGTEASPTIVTIPAGEASLYMRVEVSEQEEDVTLTVCSEYDTESDDSQPAMVNTYCNLILVRNYTTPEPPTVTPTNTAEATATNTAETTATNTAEATATNTAEATATNTAEATATNTAEATATQTPIPVQFTAVWTDTSIVLRGGFGTVNVCATNVSSETTVYIDPDGAGTGVTGWPTRSTAGLTFPANDGSEQCQTVDIFNSDTNRPVGNRNILVEIRSEPGETAGIEYAQTETRVFEGEPEPTPTPTSEP